MKVETLKETLSQILNIQLKAVNGKTNIPILSNVLLKADTSKIFLSTTNLEISIVSWIAAEVSQAGQVTVPIKRFLEYVSTLPEGAISLELIEKELNVVSKNSKASFNTIDPQEYPKIPEIKDDPICRINSNILFNAINAVSFSASRDETKPTFTGVYIVIDKSTIEFVAIDGFRMSRKIIEVETGISTALSFIVPASYIEEISRLGGEKEEEVKIYSLTDRNQIGLVYKNSQFIIRLIEGTYPNYLRIIPQEFTTDLLINRQEFLDAIKISNIFASQKEINKINIKIEDDHLIVSSSQKEVGENETRIDCQIKGQSGVIQYNAKYLQDAVTHLHEEFILIRLVLNKDLPSVLYNSREGTFEIDESYLHLMTPLQLKND